MEAGRSDVERTAAGLARRLPEPLGGLARVAYNYSWSWLPGGPEAFRSLDPARWRMCGANPVRLLEEASWESLERAAGDPAIVERVAQVEQALHEDLAREPAPDRPIAFFCAEYAVHASLPIYSGGLGALAGDILKQASDDAVPLAGIGLLYRRGYFRQRIDASGWQQEYWVHTDPERTPAVRITAPDGGPLTVGVDIGGTEVRAAIWRVEVGRVPLFLLDADLPENDPLSRWITARLYDGDGATRLAQYVLLGCGGIAALEALGIEPGVVHLNEGHAAFAALALARERMRGGASLEDAFAAARELTVFTTHTPVPAGNDTYPADQVAGVLGGICGELGLDPEAVIRLGRSNPDDPHEPFGVTQFALRTSRAANGVSRRHGAVARGMWHALWPESGPDTVPIGHVTNGVHPASWLGPEMRALLDRHLGRDWERNAADPEAWAGVDAIPDEELWTAREEQRRHLVTFVRERSVIDRLARGEARDYVELAARRLDDDALTIGFARRLATYKRLHLLLQDPARALALLGGDRPVQIILAGKAHPRDDDAKRVVQGLFAARAERSVGERVVFLEDYSLSIAARLVRGCDVWVNVPRPPLEASGTSGMKSAMNGGLQLSVLDGWWSEAYEESNGWAITGDEDADHGAQDGRDAAELYRLLEQEVVPAFHDRDEAGVPRAWVARMKTSLRTLGPRYCAQRMLRDYREQVYGAVSPTPG